MRRRTHSRRATVVVLALAIAAMLSVAVPSRALYCSTALDKACRVVFGTYCKVAHKDPCFP